MSVKQIEAIHDYVKKTFRNDTTGHDFYHMQRVAHMSQKIAENEQANDFICEIGGWLHDIGDPKLFSEPKIAIRQMDDFLYSILLTKEEITKIHQAIEDVSFSKRNIPETIEGKIVQDADRLDALGAIGIARTFAYGGASNQLIYTNEDPQNTSIQHFYDKLLHLKHKFNTKYAKEVAIERHQFMEHYLDQFYKEWSL